MDRKIVAAIAAASLALSGCATTGTGAPLTVEQKAARCTGMVLAGAVLGAIIGNNTGAARAGRGAAIGAGLGVGACAVWLAFENQRDRERLAQMQLAAATTGQAQQQSWAGEGQDTRIRDASVSASTATEMLVPEGDAQQRRICRTVTSDVGVTPAAAQGGLASGRQSDTMSQIWCRGANNEWALAPDAVAAPA